MTSKILFKPEVQPRKEILRCSFCNTKLKYIKRDGTLSCEECGALFKKDYVVDKDSPIFPFKFKEQLKVIRKPLYKKLGKDKIPKQIKCKCGRTTDKRFKTDKAGFEYVFFCECGRYTYRNKEVKRHTIKKRINELGIS